MTTRSALFWFCATVIAITMSSIWGCPAAHTQATPPHWINLADLPRCDKAHLGMVAAVSHVGEGRFRDVVRPGDGVGMAVCIDGKWRLEYWVAHCVNPCAGTPLEERTCP